jgi:hypothetical protein
MFKEGKFQSINNRITTSKLPKLFDFAANRRKLVFSVAILRKRVKAEAIKIHCCLFTGGLKKNLLVI